MSLRVFLTGASRGLGLELVRQYLSQGARVFAAARSPFSPELTALAAAHHDQLSLLALEVTAEAELQSAVAALRQQTTAIDLLINNAGVNPRGAELGQYQRAELLDILHINAVAPLLIAQTLLPLLHQGHTPKLINISSQLGSFAWNRDASAPLYAASKAALNMYTRALAQQAPGVITVAVHPGWVQTAMGGSAAPLTPAESVTALRQLIEQLTPGDSGQFLNYNGQPHPW